MAARLAAMAGDRISGSRRRYRRSGFARKVGDVWSVFASSQAATGIAWKSSVVSSKAGISRNGLCGDRGAAVSFLAGLCIAGMADLPSGTVVGINRDFGMVAERGKGDDSRASDAPRILDGTVCVAGKFRARSRNRMLLPRSLDSLGGAGGDSSKRSSLNGSPSKGLSPLGVSSAGDCGFDSGANSGVSESSPLGTDS
jgi:hypothetical protein